jgi:lysozyme
LKISQTGLNLIKQEEGFRSKVYNDVAGFATCGYGHKVLPTDNFPETGITEEQACTLLNEDCAHIEFFINAYLKEINGSINQNQFDALADFSYNLGVGSLHQMLSHGLDQVKNQLTRWDHAAGKVFAPLLERREKELELWLSASSVTAPGS